VHSSHPSQQEHRSAIPAGPLAAPQEPVPLRRRDSESSQSRAVLEHRRKLRRGGADSDARASAQMTRTPAPTHTSQNSNRHAHCNEYCLLPLARTEQRLGLYASVRCDDRFGSSLPFSRDASDGLVQLPRSDDAISFMHRLKRGDHRIPRGHTLCMWLMVKSSTCKFKSNAPATTVVLDQILCTRLGRRLGSTPPGGVLGRMPAAITWWCAVCTANLRLIPGYSSTIMMPQPLSRMLWSCGIYPSPIH
jgi:hypothetical protein